MFGFEKGPRPDEESSPRHRWDAINTWLDALAVAAALFLIVLGALNLYAVEGGGAAVRQLAVVAPGLVLFVVLRRVRIERLAILGWGVYGLSVLLLAAVPFFGNASKGARRWIGVGAFTVQPSELAKLGLLLVLAHVLSPTAHRVSVSCGHWASGPSRRD